MPEKTLILGAGLAGLGTAHALDAADADWRIVEARDRVGGLARSTFRDGFTFDATGHWLHLRDPATKALVEDLLGDDALWVARSAWIHTHGVYLPYPFQTNTWALPEAARFECLMGFIEARFGESGRARRAAEPRTFRDFVLRELGEGIGRHFMFPYNEKLWTVDLDEISAEWTGRFVPRPSVAEVVRGALGPADAAQGYNARFVYPRAGGIQVIPDRLAARLEGPIDLGDPVARVDPAAREVTCASGARHPYDHLVSTLPLPALVERIAGAPEAIRDAAAGLTATSVTYVNVAVEVGAGTAPLTYQWVYFPEARFPFYRAGCASAAVPGLAPEGCRSFYVEFAHRGPLDPAACEAEAVSGLEAASLIRPGDRVRFTEAHRIPVAYVIFDHAHGRRRAAILEWLRSQGIRSIGRFGNWEYSSMEDALLAGRAAAEAILGEASQ